MITITHEGDQYKKKLNVILEENLSKINNQDNIVELKSLSEKLAKDLYSSQLSYWELYEYSNNQSRGIFGVEYNYRKKIYATANHYYHNKVKPLWKALIGGIEDCKPQNDAEKKLKNKWIAEFKDITQYKKAAFYRGYKSYRRTHK